MAEVTSMACDVCNPEGYSRVTGYLVACNREYAIQNFDWICKDGKDICVECQEKLGLLE